MTQLTAPTRSSTAQRLQPSVRGYVITFALSALLIIAIAWWVIEHERSSTLAYWEARQSGAADAMASQVASWLDERCADAEVIAAAPSVHAMLLGTPSEEPIASLREYFTAYLARAAVTYHYVGVYVLDPGGEVIAQSPHAPALVTAAASVAQAVARDGKVRVDLYGETSEGSLISFTASVGLGPNKPTVGALLLLGSLADSLFPLLTSEIGRAQTSETLLVRRDGDDIVFLNPLRHRPAGSPQLRMPFETPMLAARYALLGRSMVGNFTDYRGVAVIAATRLIPQTGWGLVSKVDRDEALADFRFRVRLEAGFAGLLIVAVATLLRSGWQRQRTRLLTVEVASAKERRQLAAIVQSSADAIVSKTLDGIITSWNPGAERLYGYTAAEAIGRHVSLIVPPEHRDEIGAIIDQIRRGEPVAHYDTVRTCQDGRRLDVSVMVSPIVDDMGTIVGASTITRDISERKRAEAALRAASAYSRNLIETSLDPLVTISAEGKITDVNAATEQVTGVRRAQLIGTDFSDYFTEPERAREGYHTVFAEGTVQDYPLTIRHASGRTVDVLYNASLYRNEAGEVQGVFAAARDVTERNRQQEELRRTMQELARSNAELQQFASVASHDLQEPLRMVASYVDLLARRYRGRLDADADEFIGYAVDGATRMQRLINDLLAYSRVGTRGKVVPVDCERVLAEVLANLHELIAANHAVVTHDPLPRVLADDVQLAQLLQNLIDNGIKFRSDAPPRVHVSAERQDGAWRFAVRDNGIGIKREHIDRLFVIFHRLHSRQKYTGTGIGLATCKRIVERYGGRIWVESEPGHGSMFLFTLPDGGAARARPTGGDRRPTMNAGNEVRQ